jgi:hypothetical protein
VVTTMFENLSVPLRLLCTEKIPAFGSSIGNALVTWNGAVKGKVRANGASADDRCFECWE